MDIYIKIFNVLFPVFSIIGIGYYLGKKDPKINTKFITDFAGNIGTPAMIFYTITTTGVTLALFIEYFIGLKVRIIGRCSKHLNITSILSIMIFVTYLFYIDHFTEYYNVELLIF